MKRLAKFLVVASKHVWSISYVVPSVVGGVEQFGRSVAARKNGDGRFHWIGLFRSCFAPPDGRTIFGLVCEYGTSDGGECRQVLGGFRTIHAWSNGEYCTGKEGVLSLRCSTILGQSRLNGADTQRPI